MSSPERTSIGAEVHTLEADFRIARGRPSVRSTPAQTQIAQYHATPGQPPNKQRKNDWPYEIELLFYSKRPQVL